MLGVTLGTVGGRRGACKLASVVILVAIGAAGVLQGGGVPILMTGGAGDRGMFSLKRESGGSMVEVACILYLVEGGFRMAPGAVLSELVLVNIPVAVHAAFMCNAPEYLDFHSIPAPSRVAFGTIHCLVLAKQPEAGVVVVESRRRPEFVETMAGCAVRTEVPLVNVRVTIGTPLSESQVGAGTFPQLPVHDTFFFMTLAAIDAVMFPLKRVSCQRVVELLRIKAYHLKITAVMIIMAGGTFFSLHLERYMVTPVGIDPGCNLLVAVQAFFIGDLFAQDVTFHAVGYSFKMCMGLCQISRAQLCL